MHLLALVLLCQNNLQKIVYASLSIHRQVLFATCLSTKLSTMSTWSDPDFFQTTTSKLGCREILHIPFKALADFQSKMFRESVFPVQDPQAGAVHQH